MGSMAEMTPWMTNGECRHRTGMHLWQDLVYTEVCDPIRFQPVSGGEGTPVYTHLERTSQPMIRLVSGDLASGPTSPARAPARITSARGALRPDPTTCSSCAERTSTPARSKTCAGGRQLRRRVQRRRLAPGGHGRAADPGRVRDRRGRRGPGAAGSRGGAPARGWACGRCWSTVPQGQIPRTEFKARRVIDDRDLYEEGLGSHV